jgi:hypothetical protein
MVRPAFRFLPATRVRTADRVKLIDDINASPGQGLWLLCRRFSLNGLN